MLLSRRARSAPLLLSVLVSALAVSACDAFADRVNGDPGPAIPQFSGAFPTSALSVPASTSITPLAFCGNSIRENGEGCDDGNFNSYDGCTYQCQPEADYTCPVTGGFCIYNGVCGDGVLHSREQCDLGSGVLGDGCDDNCAPMPGWLCNPNGTCEPACGDGQLVGKEGCDDANLLAGDGCSSRCAVELGFVCEVIGATCRASLCGDGVPEGGEACDDGNVLAGDGCGPTCSREPDCSRGLDLCVTSCGDGIMLPGGGEECDDGNALGGDGCSPNCEQEPGFMCWPAAPGGTGMGDAAVIEAGLFDSGVTDAAEPVATTLPSESAVPSVIPTLAPSSATSGDAGAASSSDADVGAPSQGDSGVELDAGVPSSSSAAVDAQTLADGAVLLLSDPPFGTSSDAPVVPSVATTAPVLIPNAVGPSVCLAAP